MKGKLLKGEIRKLQTYYTTRAATFYWNIIINGGNGFEGKKQNVCPGNSMLVEMTVKP